ncbi:MAG: hypothetical protein J6Q02_01470, partial [Lachnospiraceae bacterium]|nr:hypothetical protein [Lachnospiraceae bacterium]
KEVPELEKKIKSISEKQNENAVMLKEIETRLKGFAEKEKERHSSSAHPDCSVGAAFGDRIRRL